MKNLAIIGSTGMLGQPVTKALLEDGFSLRLLVRDTEKARRLFGDGPELVKGDVQDPGCLPAFLQGQDGLYLNLSVAQTSRESEFQPEREGLRNILDAAKGSGLKRIAYLSSMVQSYQGQNGFSWWVFGIKQKAVEAIKNSGLPYTIFHASTFMETFDKGGYRQGKRLALAGTSKHKMFLIAGADYGKQVGAAFRQNGGHHSYVVQGPEGYTADEAAACYVQHYKKAKLSVAKAPLGLLRFMGLFAPRFAYGAKIIEALNNYPEKFSAEQTWQDLGKPNTSFVNYIENN